MRNMNSVSSAVIDLKLYLPLSLPPRVSASLLSQALVEFFENLLYFDSGAYRGGKIFCESLRFERDNKESGETQHDEIWLCHGIEVIKQRLEAENHEESSTIMQGTMIWFLINTVVRFGHISVVC